MFDNLINKIKQFMNKGDDLEELEDSEELEGEENQKDLTLKNKNDQRKGLKSLIIRGVVVVAILYTVIDEFILNKPLPPPSVHQVKKVRKKTYKKDPSAKNKKNPSAKNKKNPLAKNKKKSVEKSLKDPMQEPMKEPLKEAGPELIEEQEKKMMLVPEEEKIKEVESELPVNSKVEEIEVVVEKIEEIEVDKKPVDDHLEGLINNLEDQLTEEKEMNMVKEQAIFKEKEKEKSLRPPDYQTIGRGLVYNCKGKHWACVDKRSYFQCRRHFKANKKQGLRAECSTVAVYKSMEDCETIQLFNINTSKSVEFCD